MDKHHDPLSNRLLAALAPADWQCLRPHLEFVELSRRQILYEQGRPQHHAYFPVDAVVALLRTLPNGKSTEIAVVGSEGVVGMSLLLGAGSTTSSSEVLIPGQAFRIGAQALRNVLARRHAVLDLLLRYVQAVATQIAQTTICNRHHSIEQQLCGLLLHCQDRLHGGNVALTQELVASMMGVRRESVTAAAGVLQNADLIDRSRGLFVILDRAGLEQRSCECHAVVANEYDRLLPPPVQGRPTAADPWPLQPWTEATWSRRATPRKVEAMSEP